LDARDFRCTKDNQTLVKERLFLDKNDKDILRNEITTIDKAFTRPWTVGKTIKWCTIRVVGISLPAALQCGFHSVDEYRLGPDGRLMPALR